MSRSLNRVKAALEAAGVVFELREMAAETRTAAQAADAVGCALDQIVKSIVFADTRTDAPVLFLTAGGNTVDKAKAEAAAHAPLGQADAAMIRTTTGFAIGGVSPIGHLRPIPAFFDERLADFSIVWAAAGTPHHVFGISPADLFQISGAQTADFTTGNKKM